MGLPGWNECSLCAVGMCVGLCNVLPSTVLHLECSWLCSMPLQQDVGCVCVQCKTSTFLSAHFLLHEWPCSSWPAGLCLTKATVHNCMLGTVLWRKALVALPLGSSVQPQLLSCRCGCTSPVSPVLHTYCTRCHTAVAAAAACWHCVQLESPSEGCQG